MSIFDLKSPKYIANLSSLTHISHILIQKSFCIFINCKNNLGGKEFGKQLVANKSKYCRCLRG